MTHIIDIKSQIANNKLDEAFESLNKIIQKQADVFNNFIILQNNYLQYKSKKFQGLETEDQLRIDAQKIIVKFLQLLDSLDQKDIIGHKAIADSNNRQEIHYEKMLVVCSSDRSSDMEKFFSKYYFPNLEYDISGAIPKNINDYLVIIFDYQYPIDSSQLLLKKYLTEANPYLIFFGEKFPFYPKYKERVYFSNSIFSLYARIREMLNFLKYINPV